MRPVFYMSKTVRLILRLAEHVEYVQADAYMTGSYCTVFAECLSQHVVGYRGVEMAYLQRSLQTH